jgi:hypothetical protein
MYASMHYHVSIIRLFRPFLDRESSAGRVTSYRDRAHELSSMAIKELRQLITLHDIRHGWTVTIPYVLHPIVVTSFGSLEEIALQDSSRVAQERSEPYQGLMTCLRALDTLSSYVFYAQPLFRLLTQTCQTLHIPLPAEIVSRLHDYQTEEWTRHAAKLVSSQYIADTRKAASGVENARMDAIISKWDDLTIADVGSKAKKIE